MAESLQWRDKSAPSFPVRVAGSVFRHGYRGTHRNNLANAGGV